MSNPAIEQLDTPAPVMTDQQRQALVDTRMSIMRLISEKDAHLRHAAGLTEDEQLNASVALLGALLGDMRERCRQLEVGNG